MPAETKQSPLADRVGPAFGQAYVEVFNELRGVEVEAPGGGGLPAGINNGIAQLKRINFGTFATGNNKGKPYFQAFGVVHLPKEHGGMPLAGKQTKTNPEALCDTSLASEKREAGDNKRRTLAEHLKHIISLIKLLNGQEDPPAPQQGEPWKAYINRFEQYCYGLCRRNPPLYFSFRTFQPRKQELVQERAGFFVVQGNTRFGPFGTEELARKKYPYVGNEPQVQEVWEQKVDFTPDDVAGVTDDTSLVNGQAREAVTVVDEDTKYDTAMMPQRDTDFEATDIDVLVSQAPDSVTAREALLSLAAQAGYTPEEVEGSESWEQVKEWILNPKVEGDLDAEHAPEEYIPVKGQKARTKVPDTKVKGQFREVTCDIIAVDTDKKTVDLKNTATKAVYKGIAWDKLLQD